MQDNSIRLISAGDFNTNNPAQVLPPVQRTTYEIAAAKSLLRIRSPDALGLEDEDDVMSNGEIEHQQPSLDYAPQSFEFRGAEKQGTSRLGGRVSDVAGVVDIGQGKPYGDQRDEAASIDTSESRPTNALKALNGVAANDGLGSTVEQEGGEAEATKQHQNASNGIEGNEIPIVYGDYGEQGGGGLIWVPTVHASDMGSVYGASHRSANTLSKILPSGKKAPANGNFLPIPERGARHQLGYRSPQTKLKITQQVDANPPRLLRQNPLSLLRSLIGTRIDHRSQEGTGLYCRRRTVTCMGSRQE